MGLLDNLLKSIVNNPGSGATPTTVAPVQQSVAAQEAAKPAAKAAGQSTDTSPVKALRGITKKTPAQTATTPAQTQTPAQRAALTPVPLPTGAVVTPAQSPAQRAAAMNTTTGEGASKPKASETAARLNAESLKGLDIPSLYSSVTTRTRHPGAQFTTESDTLRTYRTELDTMYKDEVEPAYTAFKKAEEDYQAGQILYSEYLDARDEYIDVYNRYQPRVDAFKDLYSTSDRTFWDHSDLEDLEDALSLYNSALTEGQSRIGELDTRMAELSKAYEAQGEALQANLDALKAAKLDYEAGAISYEKYTEAYEKFDASRKELLATGHSIAELEGQYNAQAMYLTEMAGISNYGSDAYERRYYEIHPEIIFRNNALAEAGIVANNARAVEDALKNYQQGGNVDLLSRPEVDTSELTKAGWTDVGEGTATVFTSTFGSHDFLPPSERRMTDPTAINLTPIVVDGEGNVVRVLSPKELEEYARGILLDGKIDDLGLQIGGEFTGADAITDASKAAENIHKLQEAMLSENYTGDVLLNDANLQTIYSKLDELREEYKTADEERQKEIAEQIRVYNWVLDEGYTFADMDLGSLREQTKFFRDRLDAAESEMEELSYIERLEAYENWGGEPPVIPPGRDVTADRARYNELRSIQADATQWLQRIENHRYDTIYEGVLDSLPKQTRDKIDKYILSGGQFEDQSKGDRLASGPLQSANGFLIPTVDPTLDERMTVVNEIRDELQAAGYDDKQIADIMHYVAIHADQARTSALMKDMTADSMEANALTNFLFQRLASTGKYTGAISIAAQNLFGTPDTFTGSAAPVNYYDDANLMAHAFRAVGKGQEQKTLQWVADMYGTTTEDETVQLEAKILNGAYNLFGSMADSTVSKFLGVAGGDLGLLLMSTGAATDTMIEMHEKGYSDEACFTSGVVAGLAEYWSEHANLDELLGLVNRSGTTGVTLTDVMSFLRHDAFRQAKSEMAEEVFSDIVNTTFDMTAGRLVNGGLTQINYDALQKQREDPTLSWADAVRGAWKDYALEVGQDALGGFLSGYGMAGIGAVGGYAFNNTGRRLGAAVQGNGDHSDNTYRLIEDTRKLEASAAKTAAGLDGDVGNASTYQIGRRLNGFMDYRILDAAEVRLKELGVPEGRITPELLRAINAAAGGDPLTHTERKALRESVEGQQAMHELQSYRDELRAAEEENRSINTEGQEEWAINAEAMRELTQLQYTTTNVGAETTAQRVGALEQQYKAAQEANPNATVLTPIAEMIEANGAPADVANSQGQLLDKVFSGENLTGKEMRRLDLNNPAVRKAFVERTGMTGIPAGHIADGLKRVYVNQASRESRLIQERQAALKEGTDRLDAINRQKSAERSKALAEEANRAKKQNPFARILSSLTGRKQRRINAANRQADAQAMAVASAASQFTPGMTENQVIAQILQQTGVEIVSRAQYIASALREFGVDSYDQLSSSQKAAVETMYTQYLRGQGLSEDAVRALENAQAGRTKTARAGELIFEDSVDQSKIFGKDGEYDTRDIRGASIAVLDRMAKTLGLKIYLYESQNIGGTQKAVSDEGMILSDNGWFDPRDNSIHLDINAGQDGQGVILFTAAHELTHLIKRGSEEQFETFKQFLFDQYRHYYGGATLEQLINNQIQKAKAQGRTIDRATAEEEVVADSCERMLTDGNVVQTLESLRAADQSLFEKIVNFLRDLFDKITGMYADMDPDSAEGKMTAEMVGAFDELQYLWTEALDTATQRLNEMAPKDIDGEPGTPQFSMRSYAQGAGFELRMNEEGKPEIYDRNGKRVEKVTASMVVDSPLGKLVQDAVRLQGLSRADAQKQYQFIADLTNMIIQYRDAAVVWETAGSVMFSAIKANSDTQYSRTIDFSTICKKTQQIINVMSGAMKELGHGLSRVDVEAAYEEIHKAGEQVPCPVCYVFSHWMGIGNILDDINRFQNKYWTASEVDLQRLMTRVEQDAIRFAKEAVKKNPGKKDTYIWDKDGIQDGVRHKEGDVKIGRAISDLKSALGRSNMLAAQNTLNAIIDNKLRLRELEDPSFTTENLTPELAAQLARGNEEAAARLRMKILESVLSKQELKKLGNTALTAEDLKKYDSRIEAKLRELEAEIDRIKNQLEPYEAYQFLNGTIMLQAEDGSWSKNENYNNGNGPIPSEILFDLNAGHEFAAQYPDTWRYRTTRGNNAGKAMLPYSDTRVGEIITGIGSGLDKIENLDQTLNPFLYEDNEEDQTKREGILQSAIENQRRQNLIGGMRYQSTSDFRHQFGSDYLMSFFEMQAIGANVQLYTKVIEAVDFLASMGADCNLSVMPLNDGYIVDENGNRKLVYSSVTGMNGEAAIQMAHKYDNVQPILVGISDAHIRLALHGTDITFVIPFHGSGNTTAQIQTLMGAVRETLSIGDTGAAELTYDEGKARDYTATQSDKHLPEKETTAQQKALWKLRLDIIQGKAVPVTQKVGKKTVAREYFSFEEAFNELSPEQQETLNKSEYLRDLFERFYVEGVDSRTYQCFLAFDQAKQIFPYEYWDRNSTYTVERLPDELRERYSKYLDPNTEYDMADVNGFRFQEYCESMGIIPRFSGVKNKKTGVVFGNFTKDSGYWKLLIDRAMFANRYDAKGNWIGYGKYRDQQKINVTKFKAETLNPKWADSNYGDVMVPDTDVSKTGDIVNKVVSRVREGEAILRGDSQVMHSARATVAPVQQNITSAATSINANKIPVLYTNNNVKFIPNGVNVDIGGGRFDNVTELLGSMGVTNLIFDPYNRSEKHNSTVLAFLTSGQRADTVTCSNCLNVIAEPDARANVILECAKALKPDGVAYFTVYEGDGTGKSRATKSGWQENRKTATYADEIREYFDNVQVKGKVIIAQEAKADLPQATWETTPGTAYRYSSRDVQNTNAAATQLDDLMGKGTARNLQALARKYEQRAEAAQKQLELERAQRKIQERQFKKELLEAKKAKGQIEKASSKALRATNNELNKTRREMQQRETALKKKMSDMATDTVWKVGIAQSNGEQRLNEQRRFYKDKLGYTEQQLKEQKKATRTAEKAGMDLALEAERQGKRDTEAALRLAEEAKREGDRRVREAEKAGMDLAMEEHRNAEKNYKYGQKWARGLQRSAVENTRKEERSVAKSKEGLLRKVLSIPGRAAVSERTRFRNKANRVMMNQETAPATPIFQNEQDSKIPKSAAEFGKLARDGYDKFYRAMVNDVAELDRLAKLQTRTDNLSVQVNIVRASSATLESLYHVGLVDKAGNVVGGSMEDVFLCHDADGKFDEKLQKSLQEYMYNKHNVDRMSLERKAIQRVQDFLAQPNRQWLAELTNTELAQLAAEGNDIAREYVQLLHWANNVRNKAVLPGADNYAMTADESQQVVDLYENDPEMKWVVDKANAIYEWWDQFMRTWAVGTSISEADYLNMREMYPHYVPTYRVDEGGHAASVRANATGLSVGEVTKAAKGSTRQLLNIEDQFVRSAQSIIKNARRNDLVRTLVEELLFDDEGVFEQFGVYDWDNADPATKQTFWDFDDEQDKSSMEKVSIDGKDAYHISCWVDGVKMSAYVNRAMFEGLSSLFNRNENKTAATLGHIGSKITQPMKNMITGYNPTFAIKNIFRDQHTALTNSNNGIAYWRYLGEAAAKIATNDSDWINFQALGGVSAELTRVEGGFAKAVAPVKGVAKVKKGLKTFFGTPGEISESLSRFAEYLGTIDRLGGDTYENRMAAIRDAAEVTVDFGRHGSIGRYINMWVPYWNANVQGLDKMIRNIAQQPDVKSVLARTSRAVLVNLIPAALQAAIIAACGKWKEYEELSDQQKDNYYCIPVGKSGHKFLKFPKSQDWAAFISTPFLRIMEGVNGRDDPMEGWFESAVMPNMPFDTRTVLGVENVPVLLPFGADWVLDLAENKNYAGSAIIPYNLQDASAKEQFDADTSLLAYYFGKVFEGSPMALDYMIDNYFGNFWGIAAKTLPISPLVSRGIVNGETKFLDRLIDAGTTVISPFISDNRYSSATMSAYYDMIGELEQEVTDAGAHGDKKDAKHYAIYEALNQSGGYVDQIRALAAQARDIPKGDDQAAIRIAEIGLMQEAMDFVEKTLDGEIKDPKLWMTYHGYGDRIMAEAEALRKYDGEFNFSGALGKPTVIYDRSGATDIKYNLKDNAEAQQEYARLRAEEYQKALNTVISDSKYKSLSPTEKAARLEEAKRIGLKKADQRMLQYLKDEGIKGESVGKTDYSTEERAAAYSVSWLLGENGAYKPALTDAFLDLYDYNDQYSFIPADSARKTFKDQSDNSKVYTLTTAQQKKYADMYHDMITKYYDTVMASPEYKAAGKELRAAMLSRAKTYANDDIKEQFDAWLKQTGATSVAQEKASGEISLEAKYAIQRALGDDHAMKQEVTDELVRLYQYSDVGEVEFFPITTAPKQYVDDRDKSKSYVWILDDDQREVYMSMMFDIYQRNVLEVMQSSAYKSADDYGKAQLLCDVRSRLSGEVQSEFKHWLRTTGAERTFRNSPEAQAQAADVAAAGKIVDGILGTARTYKQFNKARGY